MHEFIWHATFGNSVNIMFERLFNLINFLKKAYTSALRFVLIKFWFASIGVFLPQEDA